MDFEKWIDEKVADRKVLEIGGIGDYENYEKTDFKEWRHKRIKQIAKELIGGDIEKDGIKFVNSRGFNFKYFDIENTDITANTGKFERILLLDVIEHLNNIGNGLENIKNYMDDTSEFIISTPNPMALNNIARTLIGKRINTLEDHTVWMDEINFQQFAKRYGFEISEIQYFTFNPNRGGKKTDVYELVG